MFKHCSLVFAIAALVSAPLAPSRAQSVPQPQWVGTWATAPMLADGPMAMRMLSGVTLREIAHISIGGAQVRIRFTNEFGLDPLAIADAHIALSAGGGQIQPASGHAITFGGANTVNVPPGAAIFSDPVAFEVAPLSDVAVTFYLPPQVMRAETYHGFAIQNNYIAMGDVAAAQELPSPATTFSWYFLDGIDVAAAPGSRAIVAFGDSITEGALSTPNANHRWPDILAARLQADPNLKNVSVLNAGIGGNRVLNENTGPSAVSRIDRDILGQSGVRYVIVLESINDIGRLGGRFLAPQDNITAEQLEWGLQQIVGAAHEHGIEVIGATLTPYGATSGYSEKGEQVREAVNNWIRSSGAFDAFVDFDNITRDPANPTRFSAAADSGDHLHPGDAGYKAMGDAIDLSLFAK